MLNKNDFLKYASKLAFPIMIQNLIGTLVNIADTVMLGYVSQTAMSASSLANQYTFILFCLYYGMATGASVLCAQYWGKGDKKTVERILGLAEGSAPTIFIKISGISHIFIYISFHHSKISYHFCPQIYDRSDTTLQYQTKIAFHYQDVSANFWCQLIATLSSLVISLSILDISLTWLYASIVTSMWACPIIY